MYEFGEEKIPLCLNCYVTIQQLNERNIQMLREEQNHVMDRISSMFGVNIGARYPAKIPVLVSGGTINNNHIAINNSQIGVLNTGNIQNLNQTIDSLYSASETQLAENVKKFSEAILNEQKLTKVQQNEVLESLDVITKELFQKPENRRNTVAKTLMNGISSLMGFAANSATVWQVLYPLLQKFFKL
jgi:hypothetical protein